MKKLVAWLLLTSLVIVLTGCTTNDSPKDGSGDLGEFFGTILENHEESILVEPETGSWVRSSSEKISVSITNAALLDNGGKEITAKELTVGTKVKISFSGAILESYPAQINSCYEVRLLLSGHYTLDDFWTLLMREKENAETPDGYISSEDIKENYFDITPVSVLAETGCQIFKDSQGYSTYLIYNDKIYPLGEWFGGMGVVDIKTCDFDENGIKDLVFTYSWGSGIHRALIGLFDMSAMSQSVVYNSQAENDEIYTNMSDLVLEKRSDSDFDVYTAVFADDYLNFAALNPQKGKLVGRITAKDGWPEWQPVK